MLLLPILPPRLLLLLLLLLLAPYTSDWDASSDMTAVDGIRSGDEALWPFAASQQSVCRRQAEGRRQKAEGRRQKAEGREKFRVF
jgi:hypothetical protein